MATDKLLYHLKMSPEFKDILFAIAKQLDRPVALIMREAIKTCYPEYFKQEAGKSEK